MVEIYKLNTSSTVECLNDKKSGIQDVTINVFPFIIVINKCALRSWKLLKVSFTKFEFYDEMKKDETDETETEQCGQNEQKKKKKKSISFKCFVICVKDRHFSFHFGGWDRMQKMVRAFLV